MRTREQIQAVQKAELEFMAGMAEKVMHGFEQVARLNLQMLRDATHDGAEAMRAAASARDVPEWIRVQTGNPAQANGQKALAYAQRLAEIAGTTQAELADAMNQGLLRMQQALRETMAADNSKRPHAPGSAGPLPSFLGSHGSSPLADPWGRTPAASLMQSFMNFTTQALEAMQESQGKAVKIMADNTRNPSQAVTKHAAAPRPHARKRAA
ncbi:MAG: TIGR01841 family phasin [Thiomonas sp.]